MRCLICIVVLGLLTSVMADVPASQNVSQERVLRRLISDETIVERYLPTKSEPVLDVQVPNVVRLPSVGLKTEGYTLSIPRVPEVHLLVPKSLDMSPRLVFRQGTESSIVFTEHLGSTTQPATLPSGAMLLRFQYGLLRVQEWCYATVPVGVDEVQVDNLPDGERIEWEVDKVEHSFSSLGARTPFTLVAPWSAFVPGIEGSIGQAMLAEGAKLSELGNGRFGESTEEQQLVSSAIVSHADFGKPMESADLSELLLRASVRSFLSIRGPLLRCSAGPARIYVFAVGDGTAAQVFEFDEQGRLRFSFTVHYQGQEVRPQKILEEYVGLSVRSRSPSTRVSEKNPITQ